MVHSISSPADKVAARFKRDTSDHQMYVLHDDGLYRHFRFRSSRTSEFWFDLITWPGCLTIRGDYGDTYTFNRELDMIPFFRDERRWGINPYYWAQKVDGGRRSVKEYSEAVFRQVVTERFVEAVRYGDAPRGLGMAVRAEILNDSCLYDEQEARKVLDAFEFKGFRFEDNWEFSYQDYERSFLWACHAIVWGIARLDKLRSYGLQSLAVAKVVTAS